MLNWLKIDNLALIEHADVEFENGFQVITGETGAGKSVLLGAIALLLGGRAERNLVRTGCERCEVACSITVPAGLLERVAAFMASVELSFDPAVPEICLRRVITRSGVRNFLNDSAIAGQTLKSLGELLIDIHSTDEHHSIVSRARQLHLLDRFADLEEPVRSCRAAYEARQRLEQEMRQALERIPDAREAHELQLTCDDIARVAPEPGEDEAVAVRHKLASSCRVILELTGRAAALLDGGEEAISDRLAAVYRDLSELERIDPDGGATLTAQLALLSEGVRNLAGELNDYAGKLELDEEGYAALEERMSALFTLKRRYGPSLDEVLRVHAEASERLNLFAGAARLRRDFAERIATAQAELERQSAALSARRQEAAQRLTLAVCEKLAKLGFRRTELYLQFTAVAAGPEGMDQVDLFFSANPGETARPLREVASSGELARLMLALKAVLAGADETPILVFDEIDRNLGGETAHEVGRELARLAERHQVLCISHLAQVAVRGAAHFAVSKDVNRDHASSRVVRLDGEARRREIARLLGGGPAALNHAAELIAAVERHG